MASVEPSPDHELLAFAVDHNGYETYNLKVKKIESEEFLPDETEAMSGTIVWGADNSAYFYLKMDDEHRYLFEYVFVKNSFKLICYIFLKTQ